MRPPYVIANVTHRAVYIAPKRTLWEWLSRVPPHPAPPPVEATLTVRYYTIPDGDTEEKQIAWVAKRCTPELARRRGTTEDMVYILSIELSGPQVMPPAVNLLDQIPDDWHVREEEE